MRILEDLLFVHVAAGAEHTCAITALDPETDEGHHLYCWGRNDAGQVGVSQERDSVVEIPERIGTAKWLDVAAGSDHTCAVQEGMQTEGEHPVYCWGSNEFSQLGVPGETMIAAPTLVPTLGEAGRIRVAAGHSLSCVSSTGTGTTCWGASGIAPLTVSSSCTAELDSWIVTCFLDAAGATQCLGSNEGPLGYTCPEDSCGAQTALELPARSLSVGRGHVCALLTDSLAAPYCWGASGLTKSGGCRFGRLELECRSQPTPFPITLEVDGPWVEVASGTYHTLLLHADGLLYCAGDCGAPDDAGRDSFAPIDSPI